MKVLLLGATGLVGSKVLQLLLEDPEIQKVHVLGRRPCGVEHLKLQEFIGPLDEMEKHPEAFQVQSVLCCLGTTIKKVGTQEKFKQVDYEYPMQAARLAQSAGVDSFGVITALGANAKSRVFYNRVKGELEEELKKLKLKKLFIIRPSIIVGSRQEKRFGEGIGIAIAKIIDPLFIGRLRKYAGSKVEDIAGLMVSLSKGESAKGPIEFQTY
jgi:uncharacterized protein YbjT (DUF2867 family)